MIVINRIYHFLYEARKGVVDTPIQISDAVYLTRKLVPL
ncbi:hypothetical protein Pint_13581 [Pistacia integerrima]|uniref:Uncharacterized protein n=1 Tax=Pistacia integerrima TaxID=434235 RepID=A0ACC0YB29_9ROSI|nr:hypothetical protein Pint_13581 [Pistacia integerrima]